MAWHDSHALHIFVPAREPYSHNWVEQLLGDVLKPLVDEHNDTIGWLWVTRYAGAYDEASPPVEVALPAEFRSNGTYRFIVVRLQAEPPTRAEVQSRALELVLAADCFADPRGWIPYDPISDLGGDRFIRNDAAPALRAERARLIALFVDATVRLMLHSLSRDESGHWRTEPNMLPEQNPKGSFFESVRHLFCNATAVPTTVLLAGEWETLQVGTYWMRPLLVKGGELRDFRLEVPVNY